MKLLQRIPRPYRMPFSLAVALHLLLLIFLIIELPHSRKLGMASLANAPKIIHAKAIAQDPIEAQRQHERAIARQKAIKRRKMLARKKALERKKALARKKALERQQALAHKKALEKQKALAEAKAKREAQKKALAQKQKALQEKLLAEQLKKEKEQLAKTRQLAMQGVIDKYMSQVKAAIQQNWHQPFQNAKLYSVYQVSLAPGGVVLAVKLIRSSGDPLLDRSGRLAILKTSPLPVPKDPAVFNQFRQFTIKMSPQGPVGGIIRG